jgi:hypothetical protein
MSSPVDVRSKQTQQKDAELMRDAGTWTIKQNEAQLPHYPGRAVGDRVGIRLYFPWVD